jgi:predicted homoserine dehydrogenase-like protein
MIGLYKELEERQYQQNPVRIGLIGAGQMGTDVVAETSMMHGVKVVATADIVPQRARDAYSVGGIKAEVAAVSSPAEADSMIAQGKCVFTTDFKVVTDMRQIDVMLEATGVPEIGARAALRAAFHGQHLAMMNVETDITVGPLLNWYAKQKGVLYALAAGDEPAACKELYDFAVSLGFTIVAAGKGKNNPLDRHANPTDPEIIKEATQRGFSPHMLVEFVDGSKTMIEMAAVSNATDLVPDVRGMHGPVTHRDILDRVYRLKEDGGILNQIGVVDFGVGKVAPGVFLIVHTDHPRLREALVLRDMGNGPYYTLFRPFHLCSIEVPLTCAMLGIHRKSNMEPLDHLVSEVFAVAKEDLQPGDILDGIGGVSYYSLIERYEIARKENLLPVGLAKSARVVNPIGKDEPVKLTDVILNEQSTILSLRRLQDQWMDNVIVDGELLTTLDNLACE